ncbi:arginine decarboxylase [Collibacillus ludicampi]|uniref:Arginine decarboxylase n=1 Tax=Collibacillus ludicampi TaxID=2771369 RepID=A0AAV4LEB4_9BACL|nr:aminotransferase class I/II-fold pyridoxal phosphate-dependent enzyme [Collibacillus ludicampi]GIM46009.1 arginine decarboxylase [Collibacillus ludicampi]
MNTRLPLFEAIRAHLKKNPLPLHVPGHKMGRGFSRSLAPWFAQALTLDLTELSGLDDLHQPEGAIREAEALAAEAFGAKETYFLVNGSTAGNYAMLMTACRPGDKVIVPRNAHKSVWQGMILAGAHPVYITPEVDSRFALATVILPQTVEEALKQHPDVKAVLITNPTYHGICSYLKQIAEICHRYNVLLLVDEAHGAHFAFHEKLPMTAMEAGADLAVQSTHKMLGSLTQTAMLHAQHDRYDRARLQTMLRMVQSTSPSYLLMLSLDAARHYMVTEGRKDLDEALTALDQAWEQARSLGVSLYQGGAHVHERDPFKWWIRTIDHGRTGFETARALEEQGVFCEMADSTGILAVFSYADRMKQMDRFLQAISRVLTIPLSENPSTFSGEGAFISDMFLQIPEMELLPGEAIHKPYTVVPLREAAGRIAAEPVIPYPPGIPWIVPGERFSQELVERMRAYVQAGGRLQGVADPSLKTVRVF